MNTQNTPVHIKLWHKGFWLMAIANFFLSMSVYTLLPVIPLWLKETFGLSPQWTGVAMAAFGAGVFALGAFCSYFVQRFRRNAVCVWAILAMAFSAGALYYFPLVPLGVGIAVQRLCLGATFGLAQMVLASTLVIDTCESFQRTEANHSASWFSRFALAAGPFAGLLIYRQWGADAVWGTSCACALLTIVLIRLVDFPFKAPDEGVHLVSLDRFFLPQGFPLFLQLWLMMAAVGLLLAQAVTPHFFLFLMVGFWIALLAQRYVFRNAEIKSEAVTALLLLLAAQLATLFASRQSAAGFLCPVLIGTGIGIIGSRFLLFFIKLSKHCQRGTSQSTYSLAWESGLAAGCGCYFGLFGGQARPAVLASLALTVLSLALYVFFTHNWFLKHKNR